MNRSLSCLSGIVALSALSLLVPACETDTTSNPASDGGGMTNGDGGAAAIDCPAPTAGPTKHEGDVQDNEVWTAAGSPHIVE